MKTKSLICAGAILLSFLACSQDEEMTAPQQGTEGEAYMSLAIAMPNGGGGSRAINDGTEKEEGTIGEQKVTSLMVLCYKEDGTAVTDNYTKTYTADMLKPGDPNPAGDKSTTYVVPAFKISAGVKKVVVIVNPLTDKFAESQTLASLRDVMQLTAAQVGTISTNNGFLMTNANTAVNQDENGNAVSINPSANGDFYADGSVYVDVKGTKENPTLVTIPVERAVAKIMDVSQKYEFTVGETSDKVTFTDFALVNANTKFYPIKSIRDSKESNNDYVVDPNFDADGQNVADFYFNKLVGEGVNVIETDWKQLATTNRPVFYCLENTMIQAAQMNANTTGLYYKAKYQVSGGTADQNVYKYLGKVYNFTQLSALNDLSLVVDQTTLTDESEATEFAKLGITKYAGGVCYYPYWIRHVNNEDSKNMGIMEFGIVRNNAYKMSINSVSGIGTPTPINPDPNTPDETADVMLQIFVKVLPWTVRNNSIDF